MFERTTLLGGEHLPKAGPALYVSLHRNGIVDGFVQQCTLPAPAFMLSSQWHASFFLRLLFPGIAMPREKDGGNAHTQLQSLDVCTDFLMKGGELVVFPEGTSSLGPRHLPFKTGAARILAAALERGLSLPVIPIALHYERAWSFRSKVEVVAGPPIDLSLDASLTAKQKLRVLHQRLETALEGVGLNVADEAEQARVEALAYVATLGTKLPYAKALKAFEAGVPEGIGSAWDDLQTEFGRRRVLRHQGVPLVPTGPLLLYLAAFLLLAPPCALGFILNLPPIALGHWAGRRFPDGPNVITLWRILVGVPAFLLWASLLLGLSLAWGHPMMFLLWALFTLVALKSLYRVKKLAVTLHNAFTCRDLRGQMRAFHAAVVAHARKAQVP